MTITRIILVAFLSIVVLFSISMISCWFVTVNGQQETTAPPSGHGKVFVMYAASLINTFEDSLGAAFQKQTGYAYTGEARGSLQIANMITDGQRKPDVFVSAGTIPITKLMINSSSVAGGKTPLVQWLIKFASAEMVIAYLPNSRFHSDLDKAKKGEIPWYLVLSEPGFKFGRTDPELDPKGYYMIIAAKLSNVYYHDTTIEQRILGDVGNSKQLFPEETLRTTLDTGQLDAIAAYKHEAVAKGLSYVTLPQQISLANPTYSDFYKTASYTLQTGKTIYGEPIYFSLTIPQTVTNLNGGISFVEFLLSTDGQRILQSQGLNHIKPLVEGKVNKVPYSIMNITMLPAPNG
jgi:molybdate/tungstate transport system substrate-binding protein